MATLGESHASGGVGFGAGETTVGFQLLVCHHSRANRSPSPAPVAPYMHLRRKSFRAASNSLLNNSLLQSFTLLNGLLAALSRVLLMTAMNAALARSDAARLLSTPISMPFRKVSATTRSSSGPAITDDAATSGNSGKTMLSWTFSRQIDGASGCQTAATSTDLEEFPLLHPAPGATRCRVRLFFSAGAPTYAGSTDVARTASLLARN